MVMCVPADQLVLGDMELLRPLRYYSGHCNSYMFELGLCINEPHRLLACAGVDRRVRIWSLDNDTPCVELGSQGVEMCRINSSRSADEELPAPATALSWIPYESTPELPALAVASAQQVRVYARALARVELP